MSLRIAIFGDSYVRRLETFCSGDLLVSSVVSWVGVGGLRAANCQRELTRAIGAGPDTAFVCIGGNDFCSSSNPLAIFRDISSAVEKFKSAGVQTVFVARILGRTRFPKDRNMTTELFDRKRRTVNRKLQKRYGDRVISFDSLSVKVHLGSDGVHFNDEGMRLYYTRIRQVLEQHKVGVSVVMSLSLCKILRHTAHRRNITIDNQGFVELGELKQQPELLQLTAASLTQIVEKDAKGRFECKSDSATMYVRAVQGHSMPVRIEMERVVKPCAMVHGTSLWAWSLISKDGIRPMHRLHIHCASGPGATSGYRACSEVLVHLNTAMLLSAGCEIYRAANGVLLTAGIQVGVSMLVQRHGHARSLPVIAMHSPCKMTTQRWLIATLYARIDSLVGGGGINLWILDNMALYIRTSQLRYVISSSVPARPK